MRSVGFNISSNSDHTKTSVPVSQLEAEEVEPPRRRSLRLQADDENQPSSTGTPTANIHSSSLSEAGSASSSTSGRKRRQQSNRDAAESSSTPASRFAYLSKSQSASSVSIVVTKKRKLAKNKQAPGHQHQENISDAEGEVSGEDTADSRSQDLTPNDTPETSIVSASSASRGSRRRLAPGMRSRDEDMQGLEDSSNTVKPTVKKRGGRQKKIKEEEPDDYRLDASGSSSKKVGRRQVKRSTRSNTSIAQLKSPLKRQRKALIEIFPEDEEEQELAPTQDSSSRPQDSAASEAAHLVASNDAKAGVDESATGDKGTAPIDAASPALGAQPSDIATLGNEEEIAPNSSVRPATPTTPTTPIIPALRASLITDHDAEDDSSLEPSRILGTGSTTPVRRKAVSLLDSEEAEVVVVDPATPIRRAAQKSDFEGWEDEEGRSSSPRRLTSPFISPSQWPLNGMLTVSTPIRKRTPTQPVPGISPRQKVKDVVGNAGLKASTRHAGMDRTHSPSSPSTPLKRKTVRLDMSPEKKHSRLIDRLEGLMHENAASEVMAVAEHALMKEVRDLRRSQNRERRQMVEDTTPPAHTDGDGPQSKIVGIGTSMDEIEAGDDHIGHIDVNLRTPVKQTGSRSYESTTPLTTPINKTPLPISKVISAIGAASRRNNNTASSPFVRTPVKKAVSALRLEDLEVDEDEDEDAAEVGSRDLGQVRRNRMEARTEGPLNSTTESAARVQARQGENDKQRDLTRGRRDNTSASAPNTLQQKQPPVPQKQEEQRRQRPPAELRTRFHSDPKEDRRRYNLVRQANLSEEELKMTVEEFHRACVTEMVMALEIQAEELVQKFEEESERHLERHGLELVSDDHKHRKVVALRVLKQGTTVITSRPLCNPVIFPTHRSLHCETCFRSRTSKSRADASAIELERCSVCKKRYYCNRECFTVAWKGWHRWICADKEQEDLDYEMLKMVVMSIERLRNGTYKDEAEDEQQQQHDGSSLASGNVKGESLALTAYVFSTLMGHEAVSDPGVLANYTEIATRIREQLLQSKFAFKSVSSRGEPPSVTELVQYLCRFHCNNFSIHDAELFTMAEGTFPIGALFNHSCRPNAIVMYEGQVQVVRALEDIAIGQEVCTSYVDNGVQRQERRQLLKEKYYFDCHCPRCCDDQDPQESNASAEDVSVQTIDRTGFRALDDLIEGSQDGPEGSKVDGEWLTKQFQTIILPGARSLQVAEPPLQPPSVITRASFTSYLLHSLVPLIQLGASEQEYTERLFVIYRTLQHTPHSKPKPFTTTVMTNATSFFVTSLEHQSWALASKIGTFILAIYLMIYPRHHPLVGLHCFTLAKCLWNDEKGGMTSVRLSHEILKLALNILRVSHGYRQNGVLVKEVEAFIKTVETELLS
ncbi:hypothetical protein BGZ72_003985 [Mortierella alpina]|nr:hypothetical protein BGZ72_003985 [Mortierella alpina]